MSAPNLIDRLRSQLPEGPLSGEQKDGEAKRRGLAILMSVAVAFVLWFTFSMRESYSVVIDMPLVVRELPEGRALSELPPPRARVTVQGDGWELLKLSYRTPSLEISAQEESVDVYRAATESNRLPPGVAVQSVAPSAIALDLEPRIQRTLPVRIRADIDPASSYDILAEPTIEPDTVVVTGARSIVNAMQFWPTVPVALDDLKETVARVVPLADTLSGLASTNIVAVRLTVRVDQFTEASRDLEVRTEGAFPGADPIRFIPSTVRATYRIPIDQYEASTESEDFYTFVPYSVAINDTTGSVRPVVHLPEALSVRDVRFEPRRLQYRIRVE